MNPKAAQTAVILWATFLFQHVLLLGISFVVETQASAELPVLAALAAAALGAAVASTQLARMAMPEPSRFIVRLALAEAPSLFGFVSYMLSGQHTLQLFCAAIGFLATAIAFPGRAGEPG